MVDEHTRLLRGLLAAVTDLSALPHSGQVGRVLVAAAVAERDTTSTRVLVEAVMRAA